MTGYADAAGRLVAAAECQTDGRDGVNGWLTGGAGDGQPAGDGRWEAGFGQPAPCQGPQLLWIAIFIHDAARTIDPQLFGESARLAGETHQLVNGVLAGTGHPGGRVALQAFGQEPIELIAAEELVASSNRSLLIYLHTGIGQAVATSVSSPPSRTAPATAAGSWGRPPGRSYGRTVNAIYEIFVQHRAARLSGREHDEDVVGHEYLVENGGSRAWLDTTCVEERDGEPVEIGIDAKGRYAQFVDEDTGEFKDFWVKIRGERSGLEAEILQAKRQAVASDGPVEWWCLERETAQAFNRAFRADSRTRGKVRAQWIPFPEEWT